MLVLAGNVVIVGTTWLGIDLFQVKQMVGSNMAVLAGTVTCIGGATLGLTGLRSQSGYGMLIFNGRWWSYIDPGSML